MAPATPVVIGPLVPDDVDSVAELVALCSSRRADAQAAMLRRVLAAGEHGGQVLVAKTEGRVVGVGRAAYFTAPSDAPKNVVPNGWYLMGVDVHPSVRRRGIALELTRQRLRWLFERTSRVWYFTRHDNLASIRLHERCGFKLADCDIWFPGLDFSQAGAALYRLERAPFPKNLQDLGSK